jgi:hypothetical protein
MSTFATYIVVVFEKEKGERLLKLQINAGLKKDRSC